MNDLISRAEAIEAIELVDWYHQNSNKDMVHGANSDEHQAWYKADDVYKALEAVPSADRPKDGDLISRADAIEALGEEPLVWCDEDYEIAERSQWRDDIEAIKSVPSADRPRGEWIPVSEKPKDEKRTYLVQLDSGGMRSCRWTNANPFWTDLTTEWHWNIFDIPQYCKVVAWMDLEPYKGGADMRGENK